MTPARLLVCVAVLLGSGCAGTSGEVSATSSSAAVTTTLPPATTTTLPPTTTSTLPVFSVRGSVTREDGTPLARAFVTMGETKAVTGADGWFAFETTHPEGMTVAKPGWSSVDVAWDTSTSFFQVTLAPQKIRGLRVSAEAAADDAKFDELLTLADETAVNALVFDSKQEEGKILYESSVEGTREIGAVDPVYDPAARIGQAHAHGLYAITRVVTFVDGARASAVPEEKLAGPWLDPASAGARGYLLSVAAEACRLGFDEVQFDYVRYPSGNTARSTGQLDMSQEERVAVIAGFLAEAAQILHPMGCAVAADVFGIVTSVSDDQGLGQRPEELSDAVDVLSPMIYPSHYSPGWIGFEDPNEHPYEVTSDAIADALPRMAPGSVLRPYLQAFWWTDDQIRRSIQAAEDHGVGWMLWNVRSSFEREALPGDDEVAP